MNVQSKHLSIFRGLRASWTFYSYLDYLIQYDLTGTGTNQLTNLVNSDNTLGDNLSMAPSGAPGSPPRTLMQTSVHQNANSFANTMSLGMNSIRPYAPSLQDGIPFAANGDIGDINMQSGFDDINNSICY